MDILDIYASGRLTGDESRELRNLARDAIRAIPIMERLRLPRPPPALEEGSTKAPVRT